MKNKLDDQTKEKIMKKSLSNQMRDMINADKPSKTKYSSQIINYLELSLSTLLKNCIKNKDYIDVKFNINENGCDNKIIKYMLDDCNKQVLTLSNYTKDVISYVLIHKFNFNIKEFLIDWEKYTAVPSIYVSITFIRPEDQEDD
jgi:hypothetical protein